VIAGNDDLRFAGVELDDCRNKRLRRPNVSSCDLAEAGFVLPRNANREVLRSCFNDEDDPTPRRGRRRVADADLVAAAIAINVTA